MYHWNGIHIVDLPYYRKLTLHEIKVLEINANLMENDFRIKKINACLLYTSDAADE